MSCSQNNSSLENKNEFVLFEKWHQDSGWVTIFVKRMAYLWLIAMVDSYG